MERWLARCCAVEAFVNLVSGAIFSVVGLAVLAFTSCMMAGIVFLLLIEGNALLGAIGISISLFKPGMFAALFLLFLALTVAHALKTRWNTDSTAGVNMDEAFSTLTTLGLEFFSAGPIFLVLAAQDFYRCVRLHRLDIPQVSALLLWLFDKGGRAKFAEICLAFPKLNAVRVLPQLRDITGIHWWAEDGEISLSEDLIESWTNVLGRAPKSAARHTRNYTYERPRSHEPAPQVDREIVEWYATLGLPLFAPFQQVKSQYRKLAKLHHLPTRAPRIPRGDILMTKK